MIKTISILERVEQLTSTLSPIPQNENTYRITGEMYGEAEDCNSYNASFYCNGWIKPEFEEDFKACLLQKVDEFQVMRFYYLRMRLEGLAYDEILEDWEEDDAPDFPEPEITHCEEYKQIWIDSEGNECTWGVVAHEEWREEREETHVVTVESLQPWAYEPRHRDRIIQLVNEKTDCCYDVAEDILTWELSQAKEYINKSMADVAQFIDRNFALKYIRTLKIANRHHYVFPNTLTDFRIYEDYIRLLDKCDYDILNPRFICPVDVHDAHQRQLVIADRMKAEFDRIEAKHKEEEFAKNHSYLFDIHFDNGHFKFDSLDSVEAYRQEGLTMHHCIYRMAYYERHDVLSMHVSDMEGNRVATCSVDVKKQCIIELQTLCNDREWREGAEYKEIYNVLCARMHTFPRQANKDKQESKRREVA